MREEIGVEVYWEIGRELYSIKRNGGLPCIDVSSFYDQPPFRENEAGSIVSSQEALKRLQDQAKGLERKPSI